MSCDKKPCKTNGCKCTEKKQQIKDCCPGKKGCPETQFATAEDLKGHDNVAVYHQERSQLSTKQQKKKGKVVKFSDSECYYKRKCVLHKYKDASGEPSECCTAQSGHHIVPDSAMKGSGYCYSHGNALTVCVAGSGNRVGNHGRIHLRLCKKIAGSGKIAFSNILKSGIAAAREVLGESGCDWVCLKKEIDENHKDMSKTPTGKKKKGCKALSSASKVKRNCGIGSPGSIDKINASLEKISNYVNI